MNRGVKAWQLPPRLITGAYFLNAGLSKRGADDATAGQLHGFAVGTYPVLDKLDAKRFAMARSGAGRSTVPTTAAVSATPVTTGPTQGRGDAAPASNGSATGRDRRVPRQQL